MGKVHGLVEGITDKAFLERLPGLPKDVEFYEQFARGKDKAKQAFASFIKSGEKALLCLDIDDKTPEAKFAEVCEYLSSKEGISVLRGDPHTGTIVTEWGQALFVALALPADQELAMLNIRRHSFEDYLIKIALGCPNLRVQGLARSLHECLTQIVAEYERKGCASLSSAQVYQLLKPFIGLQKHETGAISDLLKKANPDVVQSVTNPLVEKLNSFLSGGAA